MHCPLGDLLLSNPVVGYCVYVVGYSVYRVTGFFSIEIMLYHIELSELVYNTIEEIVYDYTNDLSWQTLHESMQNQMVWNYSVAFVNCT